jgi:hypothetical protein
MSQEAKQKYQQSGNNQQEPASQRTGRKILLPIILVLLLIGAFAIYRFVIPLSNSTNDDQIVIEYPTQEGMEETVSDVIPEEEVNPGQTAGEKQKPQATNTESVKQPGHKTQPTAGGDKAKDAPDAVATPEKTTTSGAATVAVPEEDVFLPPVLPQATLENKINDINNLFNKGGRSSAEKAIAEILNAITPDAKIYYKKPGGKAIPLPQSIRSYLNEVAFLYDNTKVSIEGFQYDPKTGKIIGFTINDPY